MLAPEEWQALRLSLEVATRSVLVSLVPAIASVVLFVLTQDLTQPMVIFDVWSLAFAIIAIVNIILTIASHKKKTDDDDEAENEQQGLALAAA